MEGSKLGKSDEWDKRKNESPPINRKVGSVLLTSAFIIAIIFVGYLIIEG